MLVVSWLGVVGFLEDVDHADEVVSGGEKDERVGAGDGQDEADVDDEEDRVVGGLVKDGFEEVGLDVLACK